MARAVAVYVEHGRGPVTVVPPPTWPALTRQRARPAAGGWLTVLRFASDVEVAAVLAELGRQAVYRGSGDLWSVSGSEPTTGHRSPASTRASSTRSASTRPRPARWSTPRPSTYGTAPPSGWSTSSDPLLECAWSRGTTRPPARCAGLAMAGVPMTAPRARRDARRGGRRAITAPVDLADPLAREEHSLVLRRAALDAYAAARSARRQHRPRHPPPGHARLRARPGRPPARCRRARAGARAARLRRRRGARARPARPGHRAAACARSRGRRSSAGSSMRPPAPPTAT